jgi:hypothetical protein
MTQATETVSTVGKWQFGRSHANTHSVVYVSTGNPDPQVQDGTQGRAVREAVFAYIKALRALGKTRVNTREIADALDLPRTLVEQAVTRLRDEGVKPAE